jgi:chromosome partitioning protein
MMVLTCINQKGGVGKTTTVANIGVYLANAGKKVLLIDIDPQANLTSGLQAIRTGRKDEITSFDLSTYDVMVKRKPVSEVFISTSVDNLFIIPSSIELAGAEVELVAALSRENILSNALKSVRDEYDFIIIDCPPSLGILTVNAMVAADKIIIPVQCEYYALEGLSQLMNTINLIKTNINHDLGIGGVILTMYDPRTNLSKEIADEVLKYFDKLVFDSIVPRNIRLSEAPSHGKPIKIYDPNSTGAQAYEKLAGEFIRRFSSQK